MEPAHSIISMLGGPRKVAGIAEVHRTRVYGWLKTGRIPIKHVPALLAAARKMDLGLTAEAFVQRPTPVEEAA